jgi:predicted transcriptional regulator
MAKEVLRTTVVLPRDLVAAVDELTGQRRRSRFIADAVREKVARAHREQVLRETAGILKDDDIPGWETPDEASAWVRRQRQLDEARFARITSGTTQL